MRTLARTPPLALAGTLLVLLAMSACVEETDASLRSGRQEAAPVAPAAASEPAPAPALVVATLSEWSVALNSPEAAAGTISVEVRNEGTEVHALEITGAGQEWRSDAIPPGEAITMSVVLPAGSYHVYCPMASGGEAHADRGMTTSLQVR
jgi:hypothetical protein